MGELVAMPERPRIGWISNSAVGLSETFIADNLTNLQSWADVSAFCGRRPEGLGRPEVEYLDFDDVPQRWHHILFGKLTGRNLVLEAKRVKAKSLLQSRLADLRPDFLWIEFGTTAEVIAPILMASTTPYVLNVHGYDVSKEFNRAPYRSTFVQLANASHAVVCASHHTKHLCVAAGVLPEKCQVIRYALDGDRIQRNPDIPKTSAPSFVHFGRLTPKKGPVVTLEAFHIARQSLPDARLTFIGSGPLQGELRRRIQEHGLEDVVTLHPAMGRQEALDIVQSHWVFCQHSVTAADGDQEGFGLSPAEAALLGMPVISTVHNGIPEHVEDGKAGILTREWDIDGMAKAMVRLAQDAELRESMGTKGRANILGMCSPEVRSKAIQALLR